MANDSPAKSLVDIDLASLRVSAAEPSLPLLPPPPLFCSLLPRRHTFVFAVVPSPFSYVAGAEVLEAAAEPQRGVACVCFSFVRGAPGVSRRPGRNSWLAPLNQTFHRRFVSNSAFVFPGPGWDFRIGGGGWKRHLWTSIQGWLEAQSVACPAFSAEPLLFLSLSSLAMLELTLSEATFPDVPAAPHPACSGAQSREVLLGIRWVIGVVCFGVSLLHCC